MRWVALGVLLSSTIASADKKIDDIVAGYEKEAAACGRSESGVAKVLEGAKTLADEAADADKLDKGHAIIASYCTELADAIAMLKGATRYKEIEGQLDERDNKIRRARAASKKTVADLEPILHRLIPKINASRASAPPPTEKRTPAKFPSGRAVELPSLAGQWKLSGTAATDVAEYTEKAITATITAQPFAQATCDQERRRLQAPDVEHVAELEVPAAAKQTGVAWIATYTRKSHLVELVCAQAGTGGVIGLIDVTPDDQKKLVEELAKVGLRMIGTQLGK